MAGEYGQFQRRQNTLNLTRLREEAVAARYKTMSIDPKTVIDLIDRIEKAETACEKAGIKIE